MSGQIVLTDADPVVALHADDGGCQNCGATEKDQVTENGFGGFLRRICKGCGGEADISKGNA